jgi:hypothetical protein
MQHPHALIDVGTARLSALLLRDAKLFVRSVDSAPLVDVAAAAAADVGAEDLGHAGRTDVAVETPIGTFEAAYLPWQWLGPEYPTLVYHHGSGERPFDFGRLSSNSFRRLFVAADETPPVNLLAVRAPFHAGSNLEYARAMGDLANFVGMLAASVGLLQALTERACQRGAGPVVLAGTSLGGWAVNLHRACFGAADRYVPLFAGAALHELFLSTAYRHVAAESARRRPARLRAVLDFQDAFRAVDGDDCAPLLGRYDRIVGCEEQRPSYEGHPLTVLEKGHVTGALATDALRAHVLGALPDDA